ncbi:MAG: hypothetical protein HY077_07450 [Elusimicrobia bacterium]|nr:hypothetical protein [Elusimicrobiota bacterium]
MTAGPKRFVPLFLLGLTAGVAGESLLFLERQCESVERALRDDFRVVLFLRKEPEEGKRKILEEELRSLPQVDEVRGITRAEALANLRRADPELVESVVLVGDNPLHSAFEVRLDDAGLLRIEEWISSAQGLADWGDIRYKPSQVEAILQAQFYGRFLGLALSAIVCLAAAMALGWVWTAGRRARGWGRRELAHCAVHSLLAAAGAALGGGLVFLLVLPMRQLSPWWSWPAAGAQAALLACAAVGGWTLCADRQEA